MTLAQELSPFQREEGGRIKCDLVIRERVLMWKWLSGIVKFIFFQLETMVCVLHRTQLYTKLHSYTPDFLTLNWRSPLQLQIVTTAVEEK